MHFVEQSFKNETIKLEGGRARQPDVQRQREENKGHFERAVRELGFVCGWKDVETESEQVGV